MEVIDIEDSAHVQTSTPTRRMHQKLTKHGKSVVCRTTNSQATKRINSIDKILIILSLLRVPRSWARIQKPCHMFGNREDGLTDLTDKVS